LTWIERRNELRRRASTPGTGLLDLEAHELARSFGERVCGVRHALADHPLLRWQAIAELADRLPTVAVERHPASQPVLRPDGSPRFGGRPSETVLDLERSAWSLVLRNIERADGYRELLDASLDELEDLLDADERPVAHEASLVLSAPLAVTPARVEPEHHLLLQVRAERQVNVGRFGSHEAQARAFERYRFGQRRNLEFVPHETVAFDLAGGEGVYLPPFAPHWIRTGPSASVSLSLGFGWRSFGARG